MESCVGGSTLIWGSVINMHIVRNLRKFSGCGYNTFHISSYN